MPIFLVAPDPLALWQRRLVAATAVLAALTRFLALSRTPWDWDEAQFIAALREYDVPLHHPHPPGFPLFVVAAQAARLLTGSDFHALRLVTLAAALVLFPVAFFLAREMRFDFGTAFSGSLLFVFFPNIWFYGGTGFSDIAGMTLVLAACALLLRGCRSDASFLAGSVLLGCAAGFRSQSLLFGMAPFLLAARFQLPRSWRRVAGAALLIAAIVAISYLGAVVASSSAEGYRLAVERHGEWIGEHDSFTSRTRAPLLTLFDEFVVHPVPGGRLPIAVALLAAAGLAGGLFRQRAAVGVVAATFGPFTLFAWLMLDIHSVHRFSTAYVFLHAILAAAGAALLARPLGRFAAPAQVVLLLFAAARFAWWTAPALAEVRSAEAPTYAALRYVAERSPRHVWVHGSMRPFAQVGLRSGSHTLVTGVDALPVHGEAVGDLYVTEGTLPGGAAKTFARERGRVWDIARRRYFEVSVAPLWSLVRFGGGWYGEEGEPGATWRWMGKRGEMTLPAWKGRGRLQLQLTGQDVAAPKVEVRFNGELVETVLCTPAGAAIDRVLVSREDRANVLTLAADRTVNLKALGIADDPRELSVRLDSCAWRPVR